MRVRTANDFRALPEHMQRAIARAIAATTPNVESPFRDESMATKETPRHFTYCSLHVHSVRHRLADSDGISAKAVIDGLVHAGVLPTDSAKVIKQVTYSQEKGDPEETIITITPEKVGGHQ